MMIDIYNLIETAARTGKIEKGTNEVTKAIERGTAKFVAYAGDVEPKEIVQHIPVLCKEKGVPCQEVDSRQKLGIAVGIPVSASAVVVVEAGDVRETHHVAALCGYGAEVVNPYLAYETIKGMNRNGLLGTKTDDQLISGFIKADFPASSKNC